MPRTRGGRGGPRPPASGCLRSARAESGHGPRAFHLHGAAGRPVIHPRARVELGDAVVVARIAARSAAPHARGLGAGAAYEAGHDQREPPAAWSDHATSPSPRSSRPRESNATAWRRSEEHTSELQSLAYL